MDVSKKVFFGGLFEFSPRAVDEVINSYKESLPSNLPAPFLSYDRSSDLFSMASSKDDSIYVKHFMAQLRGYVEVEQNPKPGPERDFVESPRLRPLEGTLIEDHLALDEEQDGEEDLIGLVDDDSDAEAQSGTQGMSHITTYWKPNGDIGILTTGVAQEIAQLTKCDIFAEPDRRRVRIQGLNFNQALWKLLNIEPLLELMSAQRQFKASRPASNILMKREKKEGDLIAHVSVRTQGPYNRILVPDSERQYLEKKMVGELRTRESRNEPYQPPPNLVRSSETTSMGLLEIWKGQQYLPIGTQPVVPLRNSNDAIKGVEFDTMPAVPGHLLSTKEAKKIESWSHNIVVGQNPDTIPVEAPKEVAVGAKRVRVVRIDDSDEEEELSGPAQRPTRETDNVKPHVEESSTQGLKQEKLLEISGEIPEEESAPLPGGCRRRVLVSSSSEDEEGDDREQAKGSIVLKSDDSPIQSRPSLQQEGLGLASSRAITENRSPDLSEIFARKEKPGSAFGLGLLEAPVSENLKDGDRASGQQLINLDVPDVSPWKQQPGSASSFLAILAREGLLAPRPAAPPDLHPKVDAAFPEPLRGRSQPPAPSAPQFPSAEEFDVSKYGKPSAARTRASPAQPAVEHSFGPSHGRGMLGQGRGQRNSSPGAPSATQNVVGNNPSTSQGLEFSGSPRRGANYRRGPARSLPRPLSRAPQAPQASRGRAGPARGQPSAALRDGQQLIVIGNSQTTGRVEPPPGLEIRSALRSNETNHFEPVSPEPPNILDDPLENINRPAMKPQRAKEHNMASSIQSSARGSSISSTNSGRNYVNTYNPGLQISAIEEEALARLEQMRQQQKEEQSVQNLAKMKEKKLEESPDRFHDTMGQKAGKPGKRGAKESKQQKAARIAKAMSEAYGGHSAETTSQSAASGNSEPTKADRGRQSPRTNQSPEKSDLLSVCQPLLHKQADQLVDQLSPLFEAGRAFSGFLTFEIQLGQVLLPTLAALENSMVEDKTWNEVLNPTGTQRPPLTSFTNLLTNNGVDVYRMLQMKVPVDRGTERLWSLKDPGPTDVTYEFRCQNKRNEEFWLIVEGNGKHSIRKAIARIGSVNLHFPAHVWDACAVLHGVANWTNASEDVVRASDAFAKSLYVAPKQYLAGISYRLPDAGEITVRNVLVKRTSRHNCQLLDRQGLQLQVTEVKELYHRFHPQDRQLGRAFEKSFEIMAENGKIHYEVSIIHQEINQVLAQNRDLELGELTDEQNTGKVLLTRDRVRWILDLASHMVSKIDWAGSRNIGTLAHLDRERREKEARLTQNFLGGSIISPPIAHGLPGVGVGVGGSRATGSRALAPTTASGLPVHGVRMNSTAQLVERDDGSRYWMGIGAAQVPVVEQDESGAEGEDGLSPGDSASQVGGVPKPKGPFDKWGKPRGFW